MRYLAITLLLVAWGSYSLANIYVKKSSRFRSLGRIRLYFLPFAYLLLAIMLVNIIFKNKWPMLVYLIIFIPFIGLCALSVAETMERLRLGSEWYMVDVEANAKAKSKDFKNNFNEYKQMVINSGQDIKNLSDEEIFDIGRKIKYDKLLKIRKKRKK